MLTVLGSADGLRWKHLAQRPVIRTGSFDSLNIANPLGGLDQLLHGRAMRGWGRARIPDPVLYTVRGFDAAARSFRYDVNSRFGSTDPARSLARTPFRITLDVRIDLGKPLSEQQLDRWLTPGRGGDARPSGRNFRLADRDSLRPRAGKQQIERLGGSTSTVKAAMSHVMGMGQSVSTGMAKDELVKNALAAVAVVLLRLRGKATGDVGLAILFYGGLAAGVLMSGIAGAGRWSGPSARWWRPACCG